MATPNFFCNIDALQLLLNQENPEAEQDIDLTVDLVELPYLLLFSNDENSWTMKVVQRGELYKRDGSGVEAGSVVVDKESGEGQVSASQELGQLMEALFAFCMKLSAYAQSENMEKLYADLDPEEAGIHLTAENGTLSYRVVSGRERPDMMCTTLFGAPTMCRPYWEDFMARSALESMSLEELEQAGEEGDADAMIRLCEIYVKGSDIPQVEPNPDKAFYWNHKMAEETDEAIPAFNLGLYYAKGIGAERNFEKAAQWMEEAAVRGDEDGMKAAGNYRHAAELLKKAEGGDVAAQAEMAEFFMSMSGSLNDFGPEKDYADSLYWAKKAAENGNATGLFVQAIASINGQGVPQNHAKAVELFTQAALLGHVDSVFSLGSDAYQNQNYPFAFQLLRRAAELGSGKAMLLIGLCYEHGQGCKGNLKKAVEWYKKAYRELGQETVKQHILELKKSPNYGSQDFEGEASYGTLTAAEQTFLEQIDQCK